MSSLMREDKKYLATSSPPENTMGHGGTEPRQGQCAQGRAPSPGGGGLALFYIFPLNKKKKGEMFRFLVLLPMKKKKMFGDRKTVDIGLRRFTAT